MYGYRRTPRSPALPILLSTAMILSFVVLAGAQELAAEPVTQQPSNLMPSPGAPPLPPISVEVTTSPDKQLVYNVRGRLAYRDPEGRLVGADNAVVLVREVNNGDICFEGTLGDGFTDENGYFDIIAVDDPGTFICETDTPDLQIAFALGGDGIQGAPYPINRPTFAHFWTRVFPDYTNPVLDLGTLEPLTEPNHNLIHIFNITKRSMRWMEEQGYAMRDVHIPGTFTAAKKPVVSTDPFAPTSVERNFIDLYNGGEFWKRVWYLDKTLAIGDRWNDPAIASLMCEEWLIREGPHYDVDLCNGSCDVGTITCNYCDWCEEDATIAWQKGFAEWMAEEILQEFSSRYATPARELVSLESLSDCAGTYPDPLVTPGPFAAVLHDLSDGISDDHPEFPEGRDAIGWGPLEALEIASFDTPNSPISFLNALIVDNPGNCEEIWRTAANVGYDLDLLPPSPLGPLSSSTHAIGVPSPNDRITVNWTQPVDTCFDTKQYSVTVTTFGPSMPGALADVQNVTSYTTISFPPGTYYVNVRVADGAGNWRPDYVSYGPVIIRDPVPANLEHAARASWAGRVVPQPAPNSTTTSSPLPASLSGNSKSTWWNISIENNGDQSTIDGFGAWVQADGLGFFNPIDPVEHAVAFPALAGMTQAQAVNLGPIQVPGGRHTFGAYVDFVGEIAELNELDNGWTRSWVWSPLQVPVGGSAFRLAPPPRIGGWEHDPTSGFFNADGLRFTQAPDFGTGEGFWNALTLVPVDNTVDYDARLHIASTGPDNGFKANSGLSLRPAGCLDAVFVNYNQDTRPDWDVGVVQTTDVGALSSYESRHIRSVLQPYGSPIFVNMAANQPMALFEFNVAGTDAGFNSFVVQTTNGEAPIHIMWLAQSFVTGGMDDNSAASTSDEYGAARLDVFASTGYHCLVVYRDPKDGILGSSIDLSIELDTTPPDLIPLQAGGWDRPLVPRPAADVVNSSEVFVPTSLSGGTNTTYINLGSQNISSTVWLNSPVVHHVSVDGVQVLDIDIPFGYESLEVYRTINQGPITVRGGLHTLVARVDGPDDYEEISEPNNFYGEQWGWSGQALSFGPATAFPQPSDPTAGWAYVSAGDIWLNSDGFQSPTFNPGGAHGMWGGVAAQAGTDTDVSARLHNASDDPQQAFRDPLISSTWTEGELDFVLVNFNMYNAQRFDVGITHVAGSAGFELEVVTSSFLDIGAAAKQPFALGPGELLELHEVALVTGVENIRLVNTSGGADLGIALYPSDAQVFSRSETLPGWSVWLNPAGENEMLNVDIPADGMYCLAVFKVRSADTSTNAAYSLEFPVPTDAPDLQRPTSTAIAGIYPNPFNPRTTVSFDLVSQGHVDLNIFNVRGELIRRLVRSTLSAGRHEAVWDGIDDRGRRVASGVYVAQLNTAGIEDRKKMVLIK